MVEELDRANSIITEFLSLAKNKNIDLEKKNLNKILKAILPLIQADSWSKKAKKLPVVLSREEVKKIFDATNYGAPHCQTNFWLT